MDDAVGVNIKHDLDLGYATRGGRNPDQIELAQQFVGVGHFPFALVDTNGHRRLTVGRRGEHLALFGWDGGILFDQPGKHTAQRLNAQRQRGHVKQQYVFDITGQNRALNRGTDGHHFVGIDTLMGVFAEDFLDPLLNGRHASHAADQDHLLDLAGGQAGVLQRGQTGSLKPVEQVGA